MCISPYYIPNRNVVDKPAEYLSTHPLMSLKDVTSQYIVVPCGHCVDCVRLRQSYMIQRFRMMSLEYDFYFQTLTIKPDMTPVMVVPLKDGTTFRHEYLPRTYFQNYMKRVRKRKIFPPGTLYYAVSEYGGKNHRPHMHVIYFVPRTPQMTVAQKISFALSLKWRLFSEWSINVGSRKNPAYKSLCEYHSAVRNGKAVRNYDFHYVRPLNGDNFENVAFYVSKYVLKYDDYVGKRISLLRYQSSSENPFADIYLFKPYSLVSKGFGLGNAQLRGEISSVVGDRLRKMVNTSLHSASVGANPISDLLFYNPDGSSFPLAPYYRRRCLDVPTALELAKYRHINSSEDFMNSNDSAVYSHIDYDRLLNKKREQRALQERITKINSLSNV